MKKYSNYISTSIVGIIITIAVLAFKNIWSADSIQEIYRDLSDGFFVSGVLITGFGLLTVVSNGGNFEIVVYGFRSLVNTFRADPVKQDLERSFFEYRKNREGVHKDFYFLLIIGGLFLLIGFVFTILFCAY